MNASANAVSSAQTDKSLEYRIKGAFLYNFVKFIDWPDTFFKKNSSPIVICILGKNPFPDSLLNALTTKKIQNRQLFLQNLSSAKDYPGCHIIFVSLSEKPYLHHTMEHLCNAKALTVSEITGFTKSGGAIQLFTDESKIRFEINTDATGKAGLNVSSKLLNLAKKAPPQE